jgi:hypothetical protein
MASYCARATGLRWPRSAARAGGPGGCLRLKGGGCRHWRVVKPAVGKPVMGGLTRVGTQGGCLSTTTHGYGPGFLASSRKAFEMALTPLLVPGWRPARRCPAASGAQRPARTVAVGVGARLLERRLHQQARRLRRALGIRPPAEEALIGADVERAGERLGGRDVEERDAVGVLPGRHLDRHVLGRERHRAVARVVTRGGAGRVGAGGGGEGAGRAGLAGRARGWSAARASRSRAAACVAGRQHGQRPKSATRAPSGARR